jgi:hypothetical protein
MGYGSFESREEREDLMIETIEKTLIDLERGKLTRCQFTASLAAMAVGTSRGPGAFAAPPAPTGFRAVNLNHVIAKVSDLHPMSQFSQKFFGMPLRQHAPRVQVLSVGQSFFGILQGEG